MGGHKARDTPTVIFLFESVNLVAYQGMHLV
jgi:hypothetical protein